MRKSTICALAAVATLTLAPTLGWAGDDQTVPLDLPGSNGPYRGLPVKLSSDY